MKYLKSLLKETIAVIIGILIALFINNWNEDRKDKEYLDQIYASIEKELEESSLDLKRIIPRQLASVDTINHYMNNDKVSLYEIILKADGIQKPLIKTNSWNSIASSKIELMDYEKLSTLSDIVERKENLNQRIQQQMTYAFQNFEKTDKNKKVIYQMMIIDIIGAEERLQAVIDDLIKK